MPKTTILLREDVKRAIEKEFGKRKLSKLINEFLFQEFIKKRAKEMYGCTF
jgi:succinyl-CoA synthetase beta subunit